MKAKDNWTNIDISNSLLINQPCHLNCGGIIRCRLDVKVNSNVTLAPCNLAQPKALKSQH